MDLISTVSYSGDGRLLSWLLSLKLGQVFHHLLHDRGYVTYHYWTGGHQHWGMIFLSGRKDKTKDDTAACS